jgi:putative aminopeptidase FrvX
MDERMAFLRDLTEAAGPSGHEGPVRKLMAERLAPHCTISSDNLGSLVAEKIGATDGPRIMLSAHMDEIGFMVKRVTDQGFLKFVTLGWWWPQRLVGHEVAVLTAYGLIPGILECKNEQRMSDEERKGVVPVETLYIDVGAQDADQAKSWGIRPGTPAIPITRFRALANEPRYLAKAWDDRVGCGVAVDAVLELARTAHSNTVYLAGTAQEEIGARGAQTAGTMIKPDVAIVLEISVAADTPGLGADHIIPIALGKGATIDVYEPTTMPNPALVDLAVRVAEEEHIALQYNVVASGGSDGSRISLLGTGVPCVLIGVPTRYIHSIAGIIDRRDYDEAVRLVAALIARLDQQTVRGLTAV